jgi:hypothetical protein
MLSVRWLQRGALVGTTILGAVLAAASPAYAATTHANWQGANGAVAYHIGIWTSTAQGTITDNTPPYFCAEVWFDWTTDPHRHHDAYAAQRCGGGTGTGTVHRDGDPVINGIRVSICRLDSRTSKRSCRDSWVYDSVKAGTYRLEQV